MKKLLLLLFLSAACTTTPKKSSSYLKNVHFEQVSKTDAKCLFKRDTWQQNLARANRCWQKKHWSELKKIATFLRHEHSQGPWGFFFQSVLDQRNGLTDKSLWMIGRARKMAPENQDFLYQEARLLWQIGQKSEAIQIFKRLNMAEAQYFLAQIYWNEGNSQLAQENLKMALSKDPNNSDFLKLREVFSPKAKHLAGGQQ